ncbi:alpha/beta fold hydrolase [Georgenia subflava]|uniref:Alpha/beta fold hydrolase n=1 Tax=Georgenia subflava TaxID=1622177 RepID=A0A6N7EEV2_9MICO|nr:alpha/beta hydrolase [Georgenia subflava]MPV36540.1 alpha/beta fold hydrolase [Georgenia subflava]
MEVPTVVLVHGIRASRSMWLRQLAALEAAGIPALAPDLPGHGARRDEPFSIPRSLDVIEDAARSVTGPLVVAGLSMGGYLALHWAARTERRPDAVLAASCSTQPQGLALAAYRRVAWLIGRLPDGGAALNDFMARRFVPDHAREDLAVGGMTVSVMSDVLSGMVDVDTRADLCAIDVPVWLVNGRWDHFRGHERRFLSSCNDGRLIIVPRASHLVSLVRPVVFNRILLELVDTVAHAAPARVPPRQDVPAAVAA